MNFIAFGIETMALFSIIRRPYSPFRNNYLFLSLLNISLNCEALLFTTPRPPIFIVEIHPRHDPRLESAANDSLLVQTYNKTYLEQSIALEVSNGPCRPGLAQWSMCHGTARPVNGTADVYLTVLPPKTVKKEKGLFFTF